MSFGPTTPAWRVAARINPRGLAVGAPDPANATDADQGSKPSSISSGILLNHLRKLDFAVDLCRWPLVLSSYTANASVPDGGEKLPRFLTRRKEPASYRVFAIRHSSMKVTT